MSSRVRDNGPQAGQRIAVKVIRIKDFLSVFSCFRVVLRRISVDK